MHPLTDSSGAGVDGLIAGVAEEAGSAGVAWSVAAVESLSWTGSWSKGRPALGPTFPRVLPIVTRVSVDSLLLVIRSSSKIILPAIANKLNKQTT